MSCFLIEQLVLEMEMRLLGAGKGGGQGFDREDMEVGASAQVFLMSKEQRSVTDGDPDSK